ncbi:NAD(P)H-dependent flavin oxidoreductase [Marinobacter fonticola]|uniref:NAD(P)H-dependent flavin oxidoreductase n=1 Tax=Marinobacter fonticola TaxID=2603215 RepID=UPI0011E67ECD|nr:nitronate monooxygenase [Marinobacter fonticola]
MAIGGLRVPYPIIQAPMVGVSTPELAAAVSNAGGLGSIGVGGSTVDAARKAIEHTHQLTAKPFNVNVFCHRPAQADNEREADWLSYLQPFFDEFGGEAPASLKAPYPSFVESRPMLDLLLETRPAMVSFHFGLPDQAWIDELKASGITLVATATNLAEAYRIQDAGLAGIVAQGREAGGHSGVFEPGRDDPDLGTLPLVRLIAAQCELPVIAAGGIMDGRGIWAARQLGAIGVQMGTAFVLCPESSADTEYRALFKRRPHLETRMTSVISGRPARGFVNRWWQDVDSDQAADLPDYPAAYVAGKALKAAARNAGQQAFDVCWAGQGAALARELPAAELMRRLVEELEAF